MRPKWMKNIDVAHNTNNTELVKEWLAEVIREINSDFNDGFTTMGLKRELFDFKNLIEDAYEELPSFDDEELEWEKERLYNKLKRTKK
jgi:hypothetical protein